MEVGQCFVPRCHGAVPACTGSLPLGLFPAPAQAQPPRGAPRPSAILYPGPQPWAAGEAVCHPSTHTWNPTLRTEAQGRSAHAHTCSTRVHPYRCAHCTQAAHIFLHTHELTCACTDLPTPHMHVRIMHTYTCAHTTPVGAQPGGESHRSLRALFLRHLQGRGTQALKTLWGSEGCPAQSGVSGVSGSPTSSSSETQLTPELGEGQVAYEQRRAPPTPHIPGPAGLGTCPGICWHDAVCRAWS